MNQTNVTNVIKNIDALRKAVDSSTRAKNARSPYLKHINTQLGRSEIYYLCVEKNLSSLLVGAYYRCSQTTVWRIAQSIMGSDSEIRLYREMIQTDPNHYEKIDVNTPLVNSNDSIYMDRENLNIVLQQKLAQCNSEEFALISSILCGVHVQVKGSDHFEVQPQTQHDVQMFVKD